MPSQTYWNPRIHVGLSTELPPMAPGDLFVDATTGVISRVGESRGLTSVGARQILKSAVYDFDLLTTAVQSETLLRGAAPTYLLGARWVYDGATSGASVAAGLFSVGTAVSGTQIITGTNFQNGKAVGTQTPATLNTNLIAALTPMILSFTGVAGTLAGSGHLEFDILPTG